MTTMLDDGMMNAFKWKIVKEVRTTASACRTRSSGRSIATTRGRCREMRKEVGTARRAMRRTVIGRLSEASLPLTQAPRRGVLLYS